MLLPLAPPGTSQFSVVQLLSHVWHYGSNRLQYTRLPCPSVSPRVCSKSCPLSQWCHPTILSCVVPFSSCLQSFPASGSFLMSQFFASSGSNIGASASVLPRNIKGWFSLWLSGLILQFKRLSTVFSSTTVWKHQFFCAQPSLCPALKSVHDYWKNHSFDYKDICWQNDVFAF